MMNSSLPPLDFCFYDPQPTQLPSIVLPPLSSIVSALPSTHANTTAQQNSSLPPLSAVLGLGFSDHTKAGAPALCSAQWSPLAADSLYHPQYHASGARPNSPLAGTASLHSDFQENAHSGFSTSPVDHDHLPLDSFVDIYQGHHDFDPTSPDYSGEEKAHRVPLDRPHGKFKHMNPSWNNKRDSSGRFVSSKKSRGKDSSSSVRAAKVSKKKVTVGSTRDHLRGARDSAGRFTSSRRMKTRSTSPDFDDFLSDGSEDESTTPTETPRLLTRSAVRRLREQSQTDDTLENTSSATSHWDSYYNSNDSEFVETPSGYYDATPELSQPDLLFSLAQAAMLNE